MISTRQAAKALGISPISLSRYIAAGKVPAPEIIWLAGMRVHSWTEAEIERVRQLLPKIKNGRKTRYKKTQLAIGSQQLAKAKKTTKAKAKTKKQPQPGAAVPHQESRPKKPKAPARINLQAK